MQKSKHGNIPRAGGMQGRRDYNVGRPRKGSIRRGRVSQSKDNFCREIPRPSVPVPLSSKIRPAVPSMGVAPAPHRIVAESAAWCEDVLHGSGAATYMTRRLAAAALLSEMIEKR